MISDATNYSYMGDTEQSYSVYIPQTIHYTDPGPRPDSRTVSLTLSAVYLPWSTAWQPYSLSDPLSCVPTLTHSLTAVQSLWPSQLCTYPGPRPDSRTVSLTLSAVYLPWPTAWQPYSLSDPLSCVPTLAHGLTAVQSLWPSQLCTYPGPRPDSRTVSLTLSVVYLPWPTVWQPYSLSDPLSCVPTLAHSLTAVQSLWPSQQPLCESQVPVSRSLPTAGPHLSVATLQQVRQQTDRQRETLDIHFTGRGDSHTRGHQ